VTPLQQRRRAQPPHLPLPIGREARIGRAETQHDPPRRASARRDCGIRVGDELGDDLDQVDPALGEVLPEVAAVDTAMANEGRIEALRHGDRTVDAVAVGAIARRLRLDAAALVDHPARVNREATEPLDLANQGVVEPEDRLGNSADVESRADVQEFWWKHGELPGFAVGT
jgi:hypothetical protein